MNTEFKELIDKSQVVKAENKLRQFLVEHPQYRQGLAGYAQHFGNGVTYFENGLRFWLFSAMGGIIFLCLVLALVISYVWININNIMGVMCTAALGFLLTKIAYSILIRGLYRLTKTEMPSGGFGLFGTIVLGGVASLAAPIAFSSGFTEMIAQYVISPDSADAILEEKIWSHIFFGLGSWFFFLLLLIHTFSFFGRCMEDEKSQPITLLFASIIIPIGLTTAKWFTVSTGLLLWGTVFAFWILTAIVAYLYFRNEMKTFSISCMPDYWERNAMLHQYRNTDFGHPLLLTDWYQKALDIAQQQEVQKQVQDRTQQLIQQQAQQIAQKKAQQLIQQQAQQLADQKVQQFAQQLAQQAQQDKKPAQQPIPAPRKKQ